MRAAPYYLAFGLLVLAGAVYGDLRGWTPIRPSEARVAPRSVIRVDATSAMIFSTVSASLRTAAVRLASPTVR